MPSSSSAPRGAFVAGLGALAALASLWLPWYTIRIPDLFREALGSIGSGAPAAGAPGGSGAASGADGLAGAFAGLFKGLASVLPEEITANGWTAMSGGDVGVAVAASLVVLLVIIAGGAGSGVRIDRGVAGRMIALAGLVVAGIAVYHVVNKPGAGAGALSANVAIKPGIWVALLGGVLMIAGGLMTGRPPRSAKTEPVLAPEAAPADGAMFTPPVDGIAAIPRPDPFAAPLPDPQPGPAATFDPFAAPAPAPEPEPEPYLAHDPYAPAPVSEPEPFVAHDPYAPAPVPEPEPYVAHDPYAPAPVAEEEPVPDWAGFSTPAADPEPEPVHAMSAHAAPAPSEPRPAGVSIPPPGWTGAV